MKVVVDTNVLVSGLVFGGVPGQILTAWTSGAFVLVVSPGILSEYRRVGRELAKGRPALDAALDALLALIAVHATVVDAPPLDVLVSADPDDEQFLAAALAGDAAWIVSGDKHLLAVSGWCGITVLKPRAFLDGPLASRNR
ncbi:MAG: putative toxin-antitoxin system toxin component, PIN family [Polaromonas sp.]|nr:putative toxin-antitoxin system toxin component, PIN family [Gemmatimonadaceae bacterium]